MSKRYMAYVLLSLYKKYSTMDYKTSNRLWNNLLDMTEFELESKILEDRELIIEEFPDLEETLKDM